MNTVKKRVTTQFDLTNDILNNLSQFNITPTAKLVFLYLTSCYNPKHTEIFPKQKTISIKLGISERSVTRAIQELFNEGLILIECKYTNRYKFTSRIVQNCPEILSDDLGQNDTQQTDNLSPHVIEQTIEPYKQQKEFLNKGGNVYSEDDKILINYALKHNAKNIQAYVNKLKESGSAAKIIKEQQKKTSPTPYLSIEQTKKQIQIYKEYEQTAESYENSETWQILGKKLGIK